jgi:DNA-binding CsgD family transcriptional regulator
MQAPRPDLEAVLSSLTPRERQIVTYVAAGRPNKVIAIDLGISLRTVEAHRSRIFTKLQVRNAMQLACRLCEHGRSGASPVPGAARPDRAQALMPMPLKVTASPSYALHEPPGPEYRRCLAGPAPLHADSGFPPDPDAG